MGTTNVRDIAEVRVSRNGSRGLLTFHRPHKRNALTFDMWHAIPAAIEDLVQHHKVQAVVLQGSGEHFSAGADLQQVYDASGDIATARAFCLAITRALYAIATCPVPTVAAMRGLAIGGAMEMALAADFRVAAADMQVQFPFVLLGMVPDPLTLRRLVALVGDATARHLFFSAKMFSAQECHQIRLVEHLAPVDMLDAKVETTLGPYHHEAPYVLERCKHLLAGLDQVDVHALAEYRAHSFVHGGVRAAAERFLARR